MTSKTLDNLFISNLERFVPGICFLCKDPTKDNSFVHFACAESYYDEKQKRLKDAWQKAKAELDRKVLKC